MNHAAGVNKLEGLARIGYAARGIVYLVVGTLAVLAAIGGGGRTTDTKGALVEILRQPFGEVLLTVVALGLVGYSLWRLAQGVLDADGHGTDARGIVVRVGLTVSALTHLALALAAAELLFGWAGGGGEGSARDWTAWLLGKPFGRWLVGGLGVTVIAVGVAHANKAWHAHFNDYLALDARTERWVTIVSRFGLLARAVVFAIIGGFLIVSAVRFSSGEARGLAGALQTLQAQPYGPWLLGVVAFGLVAFGIYSFIEARYRRIDIG